MPKTVPRIRRRRENGDFFSFSVERLHKFYGEIGLDIGSRLRGKPITLEDATEYMIEGGYTEFDGVDLTVISLGSIWAKLGHSEKERHVRFIQRKLLERKKLMDLPLEISSKECFDSTNCFRYAMGIQNSISILHILGYDLKDGIIVSLQDQNNSDIFRDLEVSRDDLATDVRLPKRSEVGFDEARLLGGILALGSLARQLSFNVKYKRIERFKEVTIPLLERIFNTAVSEYSRSVSYIMAGVSIKSRGKTYKVESRAVRSWVKDYLEITLPPTASIDFSDRMLDRDVADGFLTGYLEYKSKPVRDKSRTNVYTGSMVIGKNLRLLLELRGFNVGNFRRHRLTYCFDIYREGTLYYNRLIGRA